MINVKGKIMLIKSVKPVGKRKVYDISVKDVEHYVLENGVVTHNTGSYYSADNIFILGRQQDKDEKSKEITGYDFIINVEKSRYVKEKSKIPVSVSFDGGINRWSGLLALATESGHVIKPSNGWYSKVNIETGEIEDKKYREADTNNKDFWMSIINDKAFHKFIEDKYAVANGAIMQGGEENLFDGVK